MNLVKQENHYCKLITLSENNLNLFIGKIHNEYFRIEISPFSEITSFSIKSTLNNIESEIFEAFKDFILDLIDAYQKYPYPNNRIVVDAKQHFIALKSDTLDSNILKIDYNFSLETITITIYKNPKNYYSNNCIIIDRDSSLIGRLFIYLSELLDRLSIIKKENKVMQIVRSFKEKKSNEKN